MEKKTTTTTTVAIQNHFNSTFAKWMVAIFEVPRNLLNKTFVTSDCESNKQENVFDC